MTLGETLRSFALFHSARLASDCFIPKKDERRRDGKT